MIGNAAQGEGSELGVLDDGDRPATALLTDRYELTMVEAALQSGVAEHRAVFHVFARSLPAGRRYGVLAGTGRVLDAIQRFRFDRSDVEWLIESGVVRPSTGEWLRSYRFTGVVRGYREGELYFPGSPVLTVESTFAEAVLLETVVLSILNYDSAVATTASRMVARAAGRKLIEMGSRRVNEDAAVAAARAAYIAGFSATSNLAAGRRYGVPTTGTSAHAFTLAHADERAAFEAQVRALGASTTLLVDTYDVRSGVDHAVEAAGPMLGAVRIDSGDLGILADAVRDQLDALGATGAKIVVSGDLDEFRIAQLVAEEAPIDAFGVGTKLVAGESCPPAGFVYKLVAIADELGDRAPMRPVAKLSAAKATLGGDKVAYRRYGPDGHAEAEVLTAVGAPAPAGTVALQATFMEDGKVVLSEQRDLEAARARHSQAIARLAPGALDHDPGNPAIETVYPDSAVLERVA